MFLGLHILIMIQYKCVMEGESSIQAFKFNIFIHIQLHKLVFCTTQYNNGTSDYTSNCLNIILTLSNIKIIIYSLFSFFLNEKNKQIKCLFSLNKETLSIVVFFVLYQFFSKTNYLNHGKPNLVFCEKVICYCSFKQPKHVSLYKTQNCYFKVRRELIPILTETKGLTLSIGF